MQRLRFVSVQFLRSPYSPSPKGDATRTGILRQALAKPSLLCLIKASLLNSYIELGQSLIELGQLLIEFGQSLIEFGQTPRIYIKPFHIFVINKLI
jgi:hypothetical protein